MTGRAEQEINITVPSIMEIPTASVAEKLEELLPLDLERDLMAPMVQTTGVVLILHKVQPLFGSFLLSVFHNYQSCCSAMIEPKAIGAKVLVSLGKGSGLHGQPLYI